MGSAIHAGTCGDGATCPAWRPYWWTAIPVRVQHLRDQQAELAIAQHRDALVRRDPHLVENLAGGGQRFEENRALAGQTVGQQVQIALGQDEEFGERAGLVHDAEHGAIRAVAAKSAAAPVAHAYRPG